MKNKSIIIISLLLLTFLTSSATAQLPGKIFRENKQLIYTVKPKDTLYKLSKKLKIPVSTLKNLNPHQDPSNLQVGSKLTIKANPQFKQYTVQPGDSLWNISQQNSINLDLLSKTNLINHPQLIIPEEIILIPPTTKTKLYFIEFTTTKAFLTSETRQISAIGNIYANAIRELIAGPKSQTADTYLPIPAETKVLGVKLNNNTAYLNFSSQIYQANVGSSSEFLLLAAITNTLTEFKQIQQVRILVNGKTVETIGGHVILDKALTRSQKLIK